MRASSPRSDGPSQRARRIDVTNPTARLAAVPRMFNVTERASMTEGDGSGLSLGPPLLYPAKAAVTRARSLAWVARTRGRPRGGTRILFYHRVSDERDELAVRPRAFRAQMEALAAAGL